MSSLAQSTESTPGNGRLGDLKFEFPQAEFEYHRQILRDFWTRGSIAATGVMSPASPSQVYSAIKWLTKNGCWRDPFPVKPMDKLADENVQRELDMVALIAAPKDELAGFKALIRKEWSLYGKDLDDELDRVRTLYGLPDGSEKLSLSEAIAEAEQILTTETDPLQQNILIEALREKVGMSSYDWDRKFMGPLRDKLGMVRYKSDLKLLTLIDDPIERDIEIAKLAPKYHLSAQQVKGHLSHLGQQQTTPKAKRWKGSEFLYLESESLTWLVPGILPGRGVTILGGMPGVGKTTLAFDAAAAVVNGDEFLGEKPNKRGKVLFVGSDELPCFMQDKLVDREIPASDDWEVMSDWDISQWGELQNALEEIKPTLVIIDSFSSIHRDDSFDENSASAKNTIYKLDALLNSYGASGILIHHVGKSREHTGVAKLRGNTAIAAAASAVWLIEPLTTDSNTRLFTTPKLKGAEPIKYQIELNKPKGRWVVVEGGVDEDTRSLSERILAMFQQKPQGIRLEVSEIMQLLNINGTARDGVYKALERLIKKGQLIKRVSKQNGRFRVYGLPDSPTSPPPTQSLPKCPMKTENHSEKEMQTLDTHWTDIGHSLDNPNGEITTPLENSMVTDIGQTPPQEGGERGGEITLDVISSHPVAVAVFPDLEVGEGVLDEVENLDDCGIDAIDGLEAIVPEPDPILVLDTQEEVSVIAPKIESQPTSTPPDYKAGDRVQITDPLCRMPVPDSSGQIEYRSLVGETVVLVSKVFNTNIWEVKFANGVTSKLNPYQFMHG